MRLEMERTFETGAAGGIHGEAKGSDGVLWYKAGYATKEGMCLGRFLSEGRLEEEPGRGPLEDKDKTEVADDDANVEGNVAVASAPIWRRSTLLHDVNEVVRSNMILDVGAGDEHVNVLRLKTDTGEQSGEWGSEVGYT